MRLGGEDFEWPVGTAERQWGWKWAVTRTALQLAMVLVEEGQKEEGQEEEVAVAHNRSKWNACLHSQLRPPGR